MKAIDKFILSLSKLNPTEFIGVARVLNVPLLDGKDPREFEVVFQDVLDHFSKLSREAQRNLLRLVKR